MSFEGAATAPTGMSSKLRKLRVGLFDTYSGGMPAGWTRLLLENFEFPFEVVYPPMLDAGNLRAKYDVLVFNDAGLLAPGGAGGGGRRWRRGRRARGRCRRWRRCAAGHGGGRRGRSGGEGPVPLAARVAAARAPARSAIRRTCVARSSTTPRNSPNVAAT